MDARVVLGEDGGRAGQDGKRRERLAGADQQHAQRQGRRSVRRRRNPAYRGDLGGDYYGAPRRPGDRHKTTLGHRDGRNVT